MCEIQKGYIYTTFMFAPQVAPWAKKICIHKQEKWFSHKLYSIEILYSPENWFPTEIPTYQK